MRITGAMILGRQTRRLQEKPRDGTKIRAVYDLFVESPLTPVKSSVVIAILGKGGHWGGALEILRQYGLDIRIHSRWHWWLVADQDRDFFAERVDAA